MPWTATLIDLGKRQNNEGAQVFTVLYTDGQSKLQRDYARPSFSLTTLQATARDEVRRLEAEPPTVNLTGVTVGMSIDVTPPVVTPPTPPTKDEQDRAAYLTLRRLRDAQRPLVADGVLDPNAKTVTDTLNALTDALIAHPEYGELP